MFDIWFRMSSSSSTVAHFFNSFFHFVLVFNASQYFFSLLFIFQEAFHSQKKNYICGKYTRKNMKKRFQVFRDSRESENSFSFDYFTHKKNSHSDENPKKKRERHTESPVKLNEQ